MSCRRLLSLILLLVGFSSAMVALPERAAAQAGLIGQALQPCILRDAPGLTPARLFRTPLAFDCGTPQVRLGSGDFWLISQPLNTVGSDVRLNVRSLSVWQRTMTLYALYADGTMVSVRTDSHAITRNLRLGAILQRWLPRRESPVVRLLWHIEGAANLRGVLLGPRLATAPQATTSDTALAAIYAGCAGVCLALLLFNIGLAHALRQRFMGYYCAMMVALLAYGISSSGTLAWIIPGIDNNDRLRINYVLLAAMGSAALAFLRNFFEQGVVTRWMATVSKASSLCVALPALGIVLFAPWGMRWFDIAYSLGFLALIFSTVPILVSAFWRRSEFLMFFAVAWSLPVLFGLVRALYSLNLLPYGFWVDNSTILTMMLEALLSSLAIAHRILLLARERDEAREQEMAARRLADTDPLTGLLNRRAFLRGAIGRNGDQTLILADLDHFKRVNETIGHDGGDEVLRIFARTLRQSVPAGTLVARLGGEEFAILIDRGAAPNADGILDRLRATRMPFDLTVTASIGTCIGPMLRETDWQTLYQRADRALFDAKAAGRDRVRAASSDRFAA